MKEQSNKGTTHGGDIHTEGHTYSIQRDIHTEGTCRKRDVHTEGKIHGGDIQMGNNQTKKHSNGGNIHMEETSTRKEHTRRGHAYKGEVHMKSSGIYIRRDTYDDHSPGEI